MGDTFSASVTLMRNYMNCLAAALCAAFLLVMGQHVPLAGLSGEALGLMRFGNPLSMTATGYHAWELPLVFTELSLIAFAPLRRTNLSRDGHVDPFRTWIVALALFIAALNSYATLLVLSSPLGEFNFFSLKPELMIGTVSVMAGTAIVIGMAKWVDGYAPGYGFWFVSGVIAMLGLSASIAALPDSLTQNRTDKASLLKEAAIFVFCIAAAATVLRYRKRNAHANSANLLWPWLIASFLGYRIVDWVKRVASPNLNIWLEGVSYEVWAVTEILLLVALVFLCLRNDENLVVRLVTTAVFSVIAILLPLAGYFGLDQLNMDGMLIVMMAMGALFLERQFLETAKSRNMKRLFRKSVH